MKIFKDLGKHDRSSIPRICNILPPSSALSFSMTGILGLYLKVIIQIHLNYTAGYNFGEALCLKNTMN